MNLFDYIIWVPHSLYVLALVPQIIKNYRISGTIGVSFWMVFCRFAGEMAYSQYTHLLGLPLVYRTLIPTYTFMLFVLLMQIAYYADTKVKRRSVLFLTAWVVFLSTCSLVLSKFYPVQVGNSLGWVAVILLATAQMPQVYKNWQRKTMHGFSLLYTVMMGLGSFIELCYVIYLQLPVQTLASCIRSLTFYSIYWFQFFTYRHTGPCVENEEDEEGDLF
ncbi:MAG: PQ-loop repeat-containing protein [Candidatus Dependentiae bacterium]|jgi:uncharacterized protein with PQ loop repeat